MKKMFFCVALVVLFMPMMAAAQNALDGTWKIDMTKVEFPAKPDVYLLQNGMYECKSCVPPYNIKADGTDQPVTGHPYFDTLAVKVVSDHEIEMTAKKNGKVVNTSTTTVSPDGKTLTFTFNDSSNTNGGAPVTGKGAAERVANGPSGSNAVSGSWRASKMESMSDNGLTWSYKINGEELTMTSPTGQSYTAKMDGTEAAMKGDPGISSVLVKMMGKNTIEETDKREGKVIGVWTMTVAADGKSAKGVYDDKLQGTKTEFAVMKM